MPFKPGQSGNPGGRSKTRPFRDALMMEFASAEDPVDVPPRSMRAVARALIAKALGEDVGAVREIADRIDGKVPQAIVGDAEHDAVRVTHITRTIVYPKNPDAEGLRCAD
jgi:hypothetical protein